SRAGRRPAAEPRLAEALPGGLRALRRLARDRPVRAGAAGDDAVRARTVPDDAVRTRASSVDDAVRAGAVRDHAVRTRTVDDRVRSRTFRGRGRLWRPRPSAGDGPTPWG